MSQNIAAIEELLSALPFTKHNPLQQPPYTSERLLFIDFITLALLHRVTGAYLDGHTARYVECDVDLHDYPVHHNMELIGCIKCTVYTPGGTAETVLLGLVCPIGGLEEAGLWDAACALISLVSMSDAARVICASNSHTLFEIVNDVLIADGMTKRPERGRVPEPLRITPEAVRRGSRDGSLTSALSVTGYKGNQG